MLCEICGEEKLEKGIILPIPTMRGRRTTKACLECARETGYYCRKHKRAHDCFGDGDERMACIYCVEDRVSEYGKNAEEIFARVRAKLPPEERRRLQEEIATVTQIMNTPVATVFLRFVARMAERCGCDIETMVKSLIDEQSVDAIFPNSSRS